MKDSDRRKLLRLHDLFLAVEKTAADFRLPEQQLNQICADLRSFAEHSDSILRRLSDIANHLHPKLSVQQFSYFSVPIERALSRELQDDDFLVESIDRKELSTIETIPLVLVLDNIRSAFNVGSILRSADGLGIKQVILTGYTPAPDNSKVKKTALGADLYASWSHRESISEVLQELKTSGHLICALETSPLAKSIHLDWPKQATALVFGNERFGLDSEILRMCDELRIIPMQGRKNSLNVGVCAGIVASEWRRQWNL